MTRSQKDVEAMAALMMVRGEASDVISWSKREIGKTATIEISRAETLASQLERCIEQWDFVSAVPIIERLARQLFELRAFEASPYVGAGRKRHADFAQGREGANLERHSQAAANWGEWNKLAAPYWRPGASKNGVARILKAKFGLEAAIPTIAKRLKKPRRAR